MKVIFNDEDYKKVQKEMCYIMNDLKQLVDNLSSGTLQYDRYAHATESVSAIGLCDSLKAYLVQLNIMNVYKDEEVQNVESNNDGYPIRDSISSGIRDDNKLSETTEKREVDIQESES